MTRTKASKADITRNRRRRTHGCWDHLIIAPLWVAYRTNLGTLLRTCDAVGACLAVPRTEHYRSSVDRGDTLGDRRSCVHWIHTSPQAWIAKQREQCKRIVAVELAEDAIPLPRLDPARGPTVLLLGHEAHGVPDDVVAEADACVEIPMVGQGISLNVAVAGSLVAYRLAGLS